MNPRYAATRDVASRKPQFDESDKRQPIEQFGHLTFSLAVMQKVLPKEIYSNVLESVKGRGKINASYAEAIATAMKDWAIGLGASHFCHWFHPMTGLAAEKHDAFIDWKGEDILIERFSGKQLMRGEPDASSFPSGGLRSTFEARGYTGWDPSSPPFIWKFGGSLILCIPSVFFSWTGNPLDMKIPLLRSDTKINAAALRLMKLLGVEAKAVYSTLGCEQEYFLVDRALAQLRPDLLMGGRTVFGAPSPKGQELEDHYFGTVKERVLAYMREFEEEAFALGIPLKTRHNEVAPGQYEAAPVFEKASLAVDHNILLMELMRQIATRHDLTCLLHEKPFAGINGSGKHNNWSLSTDTGINLLDPTETPGSSLPFLIMLTAVLNGVYEHAALLRASIASAGNDHRLGGHEAPPVIISVYLGEALEKLLDQIEKGEIHKGAKLEKFDLGIPILPELPKDNTDRNRTSPFAFTGNKFEFRAVGASAHCSFPITVINLIVAESLNRIVDEIEAQLKKKSSGANALRDAVLPVISKYLKISRPIRFTGDNYSPEWAKEAKKRKLPIIEKSFHAFGVLNQKKTQKVFEGVLTSHELESRTEVLSERYSKIMNIEAKLMVDIFRTQILPAAIEYQSDLAKSLKNVREAKLSPGAAQSNWLKKLTLSIDEAIHSIDEVESERKKAWVLKGEKRGAAFSDTVGPKCLEARQFVDQLETMVDDRLWPLPKYRELFSG